MSQARSEPPYLRIVAEIRQRIAAGQLRPGERVPSAREITREWGVAIATATKVLATLGQEGLVRPVPGVGTVVAQVRADPAPLAPSPPRRRRRSRGEDGEVARADLVRAAVAIADTEGLGGVSMRRVAAALAAPTTSLYRHVDSKDELVELMMDAVLGEALFPDRLPADWRPRLELAARMQWQIYRRHPWLAQVMSFTRPPMVPNALAWTEWILAVLEELSLDANTVLHVHVLLANHVRGTAVNLEQEAQFEQDSGLTEEQWLDSRGSATVATISETGPYPLFARLVRRQDLDFTLDTLFEFGLGLILDGLEVLIEDRPRPERRPGPARSGSPAAPR